MLLDNLKNKITNNIEITSDEIMDFKSKLKGTFENNFWLIILFLLLSNCKPLEKEDDK